MQEDALHPYPYYIYTFSEAQESQRLEAKSRLKR